MNAFLNCCDHANATIEHYLFKELPFDGSIISRECLPGYTQVVAVGSAGRPFWVLSGEMGAREGLGQLFCSLCATGWEFVFVRIICVFVNTLLQLKVIRVKYLMWFVRTHKCNSCKKDFEDLFSLENLLAKYGSNSLK